MTDLTTLLEQYFQEFTSQNGKTKATLYDFYVWLKEKE